MWKSKFAVCMLCITLVACGLSYNLGRNQGYYEGYGKASSEYQQKQEPDEAHSRIASESSDAGESSNTSDENSASESPVAASASSSESQTSDSDHFTGDYLYTTDRLNLREGPGKEYDVLKVIPFGEKVPCKSFSGDWVETSYSGQNGYVLFSYLSKERINPSQRTYEESRQEIHENSVETIDNGDNYASETWVWISATGSKYHSRPDCGNMDPSRAYEETLSDAIDEGYTRCQNCY